MIYLEKLDQYVEKITTEQYIKYLEYVDDKSIENTEKKYLIVHTLTNMPIDIIGNIDIWDIDEIYISLYLYVVNNIESKYTKICEDAMGIKYEKKEKSFFDDYDKEEDLLYGKPKFHKELTKSQSCKNMIDFFIRYMSTNHKLSYSQFMSSDLSTLLDNIYYNLKYDREHKTE